MPANMSAPLKKQYLQLIQKYNEGIATPEEIQTIELYYNLFSDEEDVTDKLSTQMVSEIEIRIHDRIKERIKETRVRVVPLYNHIWFRVAAILLIVSAIGVVLFNHNTQNTRLADHTKHYPGLNRYMVLIDGSKIVLHSGSKLQIANNFATSATREVTLIGEAYFDVKHDNKHPFIIHTGKVKTTVLGTAFNIKAYPGQKDVVVTVTRGRVKVEDERGLLAVLKPNQQVVYNAMNQKADQKKVVAFETLSWAKTDMIFDAMPFGDLADRLDERYGVHITFKNPDLALCPITGRFNGTESLSEVLEILSQARGTSFTTNKNEVVIDGKGCNN
jgi:transmembrane sensor